MKRPLSRQFLILSFACLARALIWTVTPAEGKQTSAAYLYGDLGGLLTVINGTTGHCAAYECDAIGDLLSIDRQSGCVAALAVIAIIPAPTPASFVVAGQNLFGATVSVDVTGASVAGRKSSENSLSFCLSTQVPVGGPSGSVTVTTIGRSGAALPVTISRAAQLGPGAAVAGPIDAIGQRDPYCTLSVPGRAVLRAKSSAIDGCLRVFTKIAEQPEHSEITSS